MDKVIIAISGKKGTGKTTLSNLIKKNLLAEYITVMDYSFAGPLKKAACEIFGWTMEQMDDEVFKTTVDPVFGITPRHALQTLGTEWGRNLICQDIWLKTADRAISASDCQVVLIPDLRFENESSFLRRRDAHIIHIDAPEDLRKDAKDNHPSESGILKYSSDIHFFNDRKNMRALEDFAELVSKGIILNLIQAVFEADNRGFKND